MHRLVQRACEELPLDTTGRWDAETKAGRLFVRSGPPSNPNDPKLHIQVRGRVGIHLSGTPTQHA